jgi:uroporphyrinogen III methyltransferase/synthase
VVLVGAGPADPELITVKGLAWLRRADVVVHDRLIAPALLDEAPAAALRIYAGKSSGRHCIPQSAISPILIHHARAGRIVVRLKGGDPFVFGRGGEEVLACRAAGVPVEVVPGVSSAVAAPAAAGIPVTHRGLASSFAVVTGHEDPAKPEANVQWGALAGSVDTLVVLMGVGALPAIAARLVAAGRPATTPVAVVGQGTSPEQQIIFGTLADIGRRARHVAPPATIVVGEVVRLAEAAPCHHRPEEPAGYEGVRDPAPVGRASTAHRPRCPPR